MHSTFVVNEDLIRRLPLPLAHLYHSAHTIKTPLERYLTAYFLWEASLKLLGSVVVVEYAQRDHHDGPLTERLTNLSKPALGHWWEFVRLLLPVLAEAGDGACQSLREGLLGKRREDLPYAAGLDVALCQDLQGKEMQPRSTVRLSELFERLIQHRNKYLGHGAPGQQRGDFYARIGRALLAGVTEILQNLDILAGGRLIYVADVRRQPTGGWQIERYELTGEAGRLLEPLTWTGADLALMPCPDRVYLERPGSAGAGPRLMSLHPLVIYDAAAEEFLFLNARQRRQRI
jgi:hypothetical protein